MPILRILLLVALGTATPITRWDYPQFSVYFEHDRVLHSVLVSGAPAG
jgi:hypothetical protein